MDRFSKLDPRVCFLFFLLETVLCLVVQHPYYLLLALLGGFSYALKLQGRRAAKTFFTLLLPLLVFVGVFNMLFVRYGESVLFTLWDTPFTLEAFFYGFCRGMMLAAVLLWLTCYSIVMTSEKLLSFFSRIAPSTSLVFSMVLSFLPRLRKNAQEITEAGKPLWQGQSRLQSSLAAFSVLVSMTLEESIEVAESMRARGFSKARRTYSKYTFSVSDGMAAVVILLLFAANMAAMLSGQMEALFDPVLVMDIGSPWAILAFAALSFLPLMFDAWEALRWMYLKRKI